MGFVVVEQWEYREACAFVNVVDEYLAVGTIYSRNCCAECEIIVVEIMFISYRLIV